MNKADKSFYHVDFSSHSNLNKVQKNALEKIQQMYLPMDRAQFLLPYKSAGLISADEYSTMTGIPITI